MDDTKRIPVHPGYNQTTARIIEKLRGGAPGDKIFDSELAEDGLCCAPNCADYGNLRTAMKFLRGEGVVWERVRGGGCLQCLRPDERLDLANTYRRSIGRKAKASMAVLASVDRDEVSEHRRREFDARKAQTATLLMFSGASVTKALENKNTGAVVDHKKVLGLFE